MRKRNAHLISQRRQHPVVKVRPQLLVDTGQLGLKRPGQHTERDVGHLQVFGSGDGVDRARSRPHVDDDRLLDEGDHEVGSLGHDRLLDAGEAIEDYRPLTTVHVEQAHFAGVALV